MNCKRSLILIIIMWQLLGVSCSKVEQHQIVNLNGNKIGIIGHGGLGFQSFRNPLPHNSFSSITETIEKLNADGVEIDIQMSYDSILFMYHSQYLDRMTNCFSCIHNQLAADLVLCRFRNEFYNGIFGNESLERLQRVVERFSNRVPRPLLFLDLKTFLPCPSDRSYEEFREIFSETIIKLIEDNYAEDWLLVESHDIVLLQMIQQRNPNIRLLLRYNEFQETVQLASNNNFFGIVVQYESISKQEIQMAHDQNVRVTLYDVKSREGIQKAILKNPDYIQTDNVPLLQQFLN